MNPKHNGEPVLNVRSARILPRNTTSLSLRGLFPCLCCRTTSPGCASSQPVQQQSRSLPSPQCCPKQKPTVQPPLTMNAQKAAAGKEAQLQNRPKQSHGAAVMLVPQTRCNSQTGVPLPCPSPDSPTATHSPPAHAALPYGSWESPALCFTFRG